MKNIFPSILAASFFLFFVNSASAEETKLQTEDAKKSVTSEVQKELEDPDLKLSIEELRKKYPIGWLAKKYGDYNEFCRTDDCEDNCPIKPKNLVCTFYYDPFRMGYFEDAKKVSLDDFSESELKSVFVSYGLYSQTREDRLYGIIDVFIDHFTNKKPESLTEKERVVLRFAFAPQVLSSYDMGCENAKRYLDRDYCGSSVGMTVKEFRAKHVAVEKIIKQKFQTLFSSKFNLNLN